jgi:hypothetical protein
MTLQEWLVNLSDLIGGGLAPGASLSDGLEWFGSLDDTTLEELWGLGQGNPAIQDFLDMGKNLLAEAAR